MFFGLAATFEAEEKAEDGSQADEEERRRNDGRQELGRHVSPRHVVAARKGVTRRERIGERRPEERRATGVAV
jgi:hypothetical protein